VPSWRLGEAAHLVLGKGDVTEQRVVELGLGAGELGVGNDEVIGRPAVELLRIATHCVQAAALDVSQDLGDTSAQLVGRLDRRRVGFP
jgi:hypothetical protein